MRPRSLFLSLLISLFPFVPFPAQNAGISSERDSIEAYSEEFPEGVQFAVALVEGDSTRFYGIRNGEEDAEKVPNADSVFEIGSLSKVFTATILAELATDGELDLEGVIWDDLALNPEKEVPITYERLATHSSGLPRLPPHPSFMDIKNPYKKYDRKKLESYLKERMKLNAPPGDSFQYSNLGYGILGYALTEVTDSSYEELLQGRVAEPLGMQSTSVERAKLIDRAVKGLGRSGTPVPYWDFKVMKGAGAILSTARDMSKFIRANFDTSKVAYSFQQKIRRVGQRKKPMGLGWHVLEQDDGGHWYWHNGGTGGFRSSLVLSPSARKGVVVLSNVSGIHPKASRIDRLCFSLMKEL
jgi:CubicO group peptidase (beta-lactamase class C family)